MSWLLGYVRCLRDGRDNVVASSGIWQRRNRTTRPTTTVAVQPHHRSNARLLRHPRRLIMTPILTLRYSALRFIKGYEGTAARVHRGRRGQLLGPGDSLSLPAGSSAHIFHYFRQEFFNSFHRFIPQHTYVSRTCIIVSPPYFVEVSRNTSQHILSFLCTYLYTNMTWQNLLTCLINCRVASRGTPELADHYASLVRHIHSKDE